MKLRAASCAVLVACQPGAIKDVDIISGDACVEGGSFLRLNRARIQFVNLPDMRVLCEDKFGKRGTSVFGPGCGSNPVYVSKLSYLNIHGIHVNAINLKEEWVHFMLSGYWR